MKFFINKWFILFLWLIAIVVLVNASMESVRYSYIPQSESQISKENLKMYIFSVAGGLALGLSIIHIIKNRRNSNKK